GQNHVLVTACAVGTAGIHGSTTLAKVAGDDVGVSRAATPRATAAATVTASIGRRRTIIAGPPAQRPTVRRANRPAAVPARRRRTDRRPSRRTRCDRPGGRRPARRRGR